MNDAEGWHELTVSVDGQRIIAAARIGGLPDNSDDRVS